MNRKLQRLSLVMASLLLLPMILQVPGASGYTFFQNGFESGYTGWSGRRVTLGETTSITNVRSYSGTYSGRFATNGGGGYENAYVYKYLTPIKPTLYAHGMFYVASSGIRDDGDRLFFIVLRSGTDGLAYAGWKRINGVTRWCITTRNGTGYVDVISSDIGASTSTGRWYNVELYLYWTVGYVRIWVSSTDFTDYEAFDWRGNTAYFGPATVAQFGLAETYDVSPSVVYADDLALGTTWIGPETWYFSDSYESGSFSKWTGTSKSPGATASVTNARSYTGSYSARFTTAGTAKVERACSYKSVPPLSTHEYSARGYFYVEKSGIVDEGDRIFFITFRHGNENLAYIGWRKIDGVNRWMLTTRNGTGYVDTYRTSMNLPSVGTWYGVELSWVRWYGQPGVTAASIYVRIYESNGYQDSLGYVYDIGTFGEPTVARFGFAETYGYTNSIVYADACRIESADIGEE